MEEFKTAKLYYMEKDGDVKPVSEKPFNDEVSDMEKFIKKNISILGEYYVFGEQPVVSGSQRRMDLLAVDQDRRITIIELKNTPVGTEIFSQIVKYWSTTKRNPDAIKGYWNDSKNTPWLRLKSKPAEPIKSASI